MKKIMYTLLVFASVLLFGQTNKAVKFAVCNDVVGSVSMFNLYKKQTTASTSYNTSNLPSHLKKFSNLAQNGLTEIKLKNDFGTPDFLTIADLNEQHNIAKETPVKIGGYLISDTSTRIYSEMIEKIEIAQDEGSKSLSINVIQ